MKLEFPLQISSTNTQISNFMKLLPMGTEFFHADRGTDGRTDMTKLIVAFRNLANAPKRKEEKEKDEEKSIFYFILYFHLCTTAKRPLKPQRTNLTTLISATVFRGGPNHSSDTLLGPRVIMITLNKHVINNGISSQHVTAIPTEIYVPLLRQVATMSSVLERVSPR